jgi:hypothetical protein
VGRLAVALFGAAFVVVHLAWAVSIASFGGFDENQHYFRAASIPNGDLLGPEIEGISDAYRTVELPGRQFPGCPDGPYACPLSEPPLGPDDVSIPSSAGVYPPAYYAVVGFSAAPFDWPASLLAMRVVTAVIVSVLAAACFWMGRRVWPHTGNGLAILAIATPATVFLGATVTPSGVEVWAVLGVTMALLGILGRHRVGEAAPRSWRIAFAAFAAVLVLSRPLSPVVLAVSVGAVVLAATPPRDYRGLGRLVRRLPVALGFVGVAVAGALAWSVATWPDDASANTTPLPEGSVARYVFLRGKLWEKWNAMLGVPNDWVVSPVAHLLLAGLLFAVLGLALLGASRRRAAVVAAIVAAVLAAGVPADLSAGFAWYQGRYALPALAVALVLAGDQIERSVRAGSLAPRRLLAAVAPAWVVAQVAYGLDYFGLPALTEVTGQQAWDAGFAGLVDGVPAGLVGAAILAALLLGSAALAALAAAPFLSGAPCGRSPSGGPPRARRRSGTPGCPGRSG